MFWNARSRPEGGDIGIQLLNLLVELVNETLEFMDGWRNSGFIYLLGNGLRPRGAGV